MEYRKFGTTELRVSPIGFGAWAIGGGAMIGNTSIGWGDSHDSVSVRAIHTAIDAGINFFDTADIYGLGHSEELLGKTIGRRKDMIIATKVGNVSRDEKFSVDYSKKHIRAACEASLKRLQRESHDYYQLHTARMNDLQQGECIDAMQELKREGKIRHWGLSLNTFEPLPEARFLMGQGRGSGFQLVLNLLNQRAIPIIREAAKQGYGIIARMPLQFGLLTGKFDAEQNFPVNDHRKKRLTPEVVDKSNEALKEVWVLCKKYNCSKTQLALSYILSYQEISVVIPGIRNEQQVIENRSGLFKLDEADKTTIETLGTSKFPGIMELIKQQG